MLIKKRKLASINGNKGTAKILQPEHGEAARAMQIEIQKAKEEARQIKHEAQLVLAESEKKLKEAETRIREIIVAANLEAKNIKEKVYQDTLASANQEAELIREHAKILLKQLFNVKKEALTQAHNEIIKIALDLAEKIIRYKVSVDPNVLQIQVVEAIKKATADADRVQVFVHPNDLKVLEESIPGMEKLFPSGVDIVALANDSVDPGSCMIETKSGQLDARFSTQLQSLTGLTEHLEVIEPQIEINEEIPVVEAAAEKYVPIQEASFAEVEENLPQYIIQDEQRQEQEELTVTEKEVLEKELLSDEEPLILNEEDNTFPFISNEQLISPTTPLELEDEESIIKENINEPELIEETNIPEAVINNIEQEITVSEEVVQSVEPEQVEQIEQNSIQIENQEPVQQRKKLNVGPVPERTREEAEELDEGLVLEYEEDSEEEKKEIKPTNILKPKKTQSSGISEIASELEENPEWKDIVEEDEE